MKQIFRFTLFIVCMGIFTNVSAQNRTSSSSSYKNAIGIKTTGISFKHFLTPKNAVEFNASFWRWGGVLSGSYQIHHDISNSPGLKWYIGPAAYVGAYRHRYYDNGNKKYYSSSILGIGGIIGLDYKFRDAPINLALDWQPSIEFIGGDYDHSGTRFGAYWVGAAIRYTF